MFKKAWIVGTGIALFASGCVSSAPDEDNSDHSNEALHASAFDYVCENGATLQIVWLKEKAKVSFNGEDWILPQALSGSGARYADEEREVWEHQGKLRITVGKSSPLLCSPVVENPPI